MKKFKVLATMSVTLENEIYAESLEQAHEMADDLDGGDFTEMEGTGDWSIYDVRES